MKKDLNIEEKANAYYLALGRAREEYLYGVQIVKEAIERIFPEIKKSDDTKIRETLIELVECNERSGYTLINNVSTSSMINWLKKQSDNDNKVGDWVAINNIYSEMCLSSPLHIVDSDKTNYRVEDVNGNSGCPKVEYLTSHYHLWTMADAKDGDVLCLYERDVPKIIFILRGTPNKPSALNYYCYYDITYPDFNFGSVGEGLVLNYETDVIKPATKEQRELLFQKMKEKGYKWDYENKKPIKI
jgi:hypothetical protein